MNKTSSRFIRVFALTCVSIVGLLIGRVVGATSPGLRMVALTGQPSPGTAPLTFSAFNPPEIGPFGQVAFHAFLKGSGVPVCTVIGFPLGATLPDVKAYEARRAIFNGAREVDMVINIGALKSGDDCAVEDDIGAVVEAAHENHILCKVIIETALLTDEEKVRACLAAKNAGADFVKTSTGFSKGGATAHDVALMRHTVGRALGVKASGGVKGIDDARAMFEAGATLDC